MTDHFNVRHAARAANITRTQLDQWVSRGYVTPTHKPGMGEARRYTMGDIVAIGALAELVRLGLSAAHASQFVPYVRGFKDSEAILVVWQGPIPLIPATDRGSKSHPDGETLKAYDPDRPPFRSDIVRARDLPALIEDPDKRALLAVNLDHVETRALKALAQAENSGSD